MDELFWQKVRDGEMEGGQRQRDRQTADWARLEVHLHRGREKTVSVVYIHKHTHTYTHL